MSTIIFISLFAAAVAAAAAAATARNRQIYEREIDFQYAFS